MVLSRHGLVAAGCGVGAYLVSGAARIALIAIAAFFASITTWSVLFMAIIEYIVAVIKRTARPNGDS